MIDLVDVSKSYGPGLPAVNHANLHVDKGEFVFVVGSSGSGKSTLIKSLLGEIPLQAGEIQVGGNSLTEMKRKRMPYYRRKLGVVFQEFRLLDDRNVFENVALAQQVIGVDKDRIEKNVFYQRNDHSQRGTSGEDETQTRCQVSQKAWGSISGFPSFKRP